MADQFCRMCGQPLPAPPRPPTSEWFACAGCGGEFRSQHVNITCRRTPEGTLFVDDRVGTDRGSPVTRAKLGLEYHRASGRVHFVRRHVHRDTNRYDEVITDWETGEIVREVHEPLSEHQGHGSAKKDGST